MSSNASLLVLVDLHDCFAAGEIDNVVFVPAVVSRYLLVRCVLPLFVDFKLVFVAARLQEFYEVVSGLSLANLDS